MGREADLAIPSQVVFSVFGAQPRICLRREHPTVSLPTVTRDKTSQSPLPCLGTAYLRPEANPVPFLCLSCVAEACIAATSQEQYGPRGP